MTFCLFRLSVPSETLEPGTHGYAAWRSIPPALGIPFLTTDFIVEQFPALCAPMKGHLASVERAMSAAKCRVVPKAEGIEV
jgi:hypothetical protein